MENLGLSLYLIEALRSIPETLRYMALQKMRVSPSFETVEAHVDIDDWNQALRQSTKFMAFVMVISCAEPLLEWLFASGRPLAIGRLSAVAEKEYDGQ